jgi:hypothetical protein
MIRPVSAVTRNARLELAEGKKIQREVHPTEETQHKREVDITKKKGARDVLLGAWWPAVA